MSADIISVRTATHPSIKLMFVRDDEMTMMLKECGDLRGIPTYIDFRLRVFPKPEEEYRTLIARLSDGFERTILLCE